VPVTSTVEEPLTMAETRTVETIEALRDLKYL